MAEERIRVLPARRFNVVQLIFFVLLIYMVIITGKYLSKEKVKITEVVEGSLTQNHSYAGLILRDEEILTAEAGGFLKCFTSDGSKIARDSIVFAIDKTGASLNRQGNSNLEISKEEYRSIRKYLNHFATSYNGQNYKNVYGLKNQLQTVLYGIEQNSFENEENKDIVLCKTSKSGLVYFGLDGLEGKSAEDFDRDFLENIAYHTDRLKSGDQVNSATAVAKVIPDDVWKILIPITDDDAAYYAEHKKASVFLSDIKSSAEAEITVINDVNGKKMGLLTMNQYMASYAGDRIVSIRLDKKVNKGLKVPKTSIVSSDLYVIPVDLSHKDENDRITIIRKASGKEKEYETFSPDISYMDKQYLYLDSANIGAGDVLCVKNEETGNIKESFTVGEKKTLRGVYNVNKGYAVFEAVDILEEDDSYAIVEGGSRYGLAVYDHIVLNATTVSEDDLIY